MINFKEINRERGACDRWEHSSRVGGKPGKQSALVAKSREDVKETSAVPTEYTCISLGKGPTDLAMKDH